MAVQEYDLLVRPGKWATQSYLLLWIGGESFVSYARLRGPRPHGFGHQVYTAGPPGKGTARASHPEPRELKHALAQDSTDGSSADPLLIALAEWEAMEIGQQLARESRAGRAIVRELAGLRPSDPRTRSQFLVVCGREENGTPRVVYSGNQPPPVELVDRYERDTGHKAWRVTTLAPGPAEEHPPPQTAGDGTGHGALHEARLDWAAGMGEWMKSPDGRKTHWIAHDHDRYPVVQVQVRWGSGLDAGGQSARFRADLDTGAPYCAFPFRALRDGLGRNANGDYLDKYAWLPAVHTHLGEEFGYRLVQTEPLSFEVRCETGWMEFFPATVMECLALTDWHPKHALAQVRRGREAFVGRPIWRGKVSLTLASDGADWEKCPPTTG